MSIYMPKGFSTLAYLYRSRLKLIESWVNQLEENPHGEITRSQVAATLRVFLNHDDLRNAS